LLLAGLVAVGLGLGRNDWPTWSPPHEAAGFPVAAFAGSLFYIAFAFAGWNAAVYVASDFEEPRRDVPRAMLIGCALVAVLYLAVNWVFVANLSPTEAQAVFTYETTRITLGHVLVKRLLGDAGGAAMSFLTLLALTSAASAMTVAGPRVYTAMAEDGFLPRVLRGKAGRPPMGSIVLQSSLAVVLVATHDLQQALTNVGAVLTLFAALVSVAVLRARAWPSGRTPPDLLTVLCAAVHVASAAWMLYYGLRGATHLLIWIAAAAGAALVAYAATRSKVSS
jgi:APA family basic amino acid/polyamine antiporter